MNGLTRFKLKRVEPGPQRTLTAGKVEDLFSQCDISTVKGIRDRAILAVMLDTGIRAFELCGLLVKNLDLEERSFTCLTKGGEWQTKVISDKTLLYLDEWLTQRAGVIANGQVQTVFVSLGGLTPGMPLTTSGLRIIFRYLGVKSGMEVSPHDMRRTFAVLSVQSGAPTRLVQKQGGWSSVAMVERYTKALTAKDFLPWSPMLGIDAPEIKVRHNLTMTQRVQKIGGLFSPVVERISPVPGACASCGEFGATEVYKAGEHKLTGQPLYFLACDSVCAFVLLSDILITAGITLDQLECKDKVLQ